MCKSATWLNIFSACFKKDCPVDEYRFTADKLIEVCSGKDAGLDGKITDNTALVVADLKLSAQIPQNPTSSTSSISTSTSTSTSTSIETTPPTSPSPTGPGIFTQTPDSNSSGGLGTGGIVGVAIGAGLGTLALIILGWFLYRRRSRATRKGDAYDNAEHFHKTEADNFSGSTPYSAQYVGGGYPTQRSQKAPLYPQDPAGAPPNIPAIVEAEDPQSVSQMMGGAYRRH